MIVQPDFIEHWKTRLLVELTGDESAPLCVIRLWSHCQHSKRGYFPDMTPAQLASICRWNDRKPACHVAMTKAGFVEKLSPKGFAAHEWADHNRQLIQKWEAGKNGGRPPKEENANELPLSEKPTDNRPITARELDRTDRTELTREDKEEQNRTDAPAVPADAGSGSGSLSFDGVGSVKELAKQFTNRPTVEQVRDVMEKAVPTGGRFAFNWCEKMQRQNWLDKQGKKIHDWTSLAASYANACIRSERGVSKPKAIAAWGNDRPPGGNY